MKIGEAKMLIKKLHYELQQEKVCFGNIPSINNLVLVDLV